MIKNSLFLLIGYLIGQGSVFMGQLFVKYNANAEALGAAVLAVSFFSFAFQFNDFGNATFIVKNYKIKNFAGIKKFTINRALIGFSATTILVLHAYSIKNSSLLWYEVIFFPLLALFSGLSVVGVFESNGDYKKMTLFQSAPWVFVGLSIPIYSSGGQVVRFFVALFWLLAVFIFYLMARRVVPTAKNSAEKIKENYLFTTISHVSPPLGGQILGRLIILSIQKNYGLSLLGIYGLVKYFQVGLTLIFSFWIRPIHRSVSIISVDGGLKIKEFYENYKKPVLLSIAIPPLSLLVYNFLEIRNYTTESPWIYLVVVLPFWLFSNIASHYNSINLTHKTYLIIEYFGLITNATVFFSTTHSHVVFNIIFGEISQYLVVASITFFLAKMQNAKYR